MDHHRAGQEIVQRPAFAIGEQDDEFTPGPNLEGQHYRFGPARLQRRQAVLLGGEAERAKFVVRHLGGRHNTGDGGQHSQNQVNRTPQHGFPVAYRLPVYLANAQALDQFSRGATKTPDEPDIPE